MKLIQLVNANSCEIEWHGQRYRFVSGRPAEVPHELADRLINSGEFMHIVSFDQAPAVKPAPAAPAATKPGKKKTE